MVERKELMERIVYVCLDVHANTIAVAEDGPSGQVVENARAIEREVLSPPDRLRAGFLFFVVGIQEFVGMIEVIIRAFVHCCLIFSIITIRGC